MWKNIASCGALWARVSSWFHADQTLHSPRTVWRGSLAKPSKSDLIASKRLLRYLCGTTDFGLKLQVQNRTCSTLTVFADSDWAGDRPTRKSVSSWVIMLDGCLLSAGARAQSVVAQSSCEAEYIAATAATSEAKYIQSLFLTCGQHVNIHLRSGQHWCHWSGKQERSATPPSSGRAVSLVASRSCCQAYSYQQSTRS